MKLRPLRALAAAIAVSLVVVLPAATRAPASSLAFIGLRPGSWMIAPNLCTMNFIFNKPGKLVSYPTQYYIGTAKHCVVDPSNPSKDPRGTHVTVAVLLGAPDPVPVMVDIGTVWWSSKGATTIGNDFALVHIDPALVDLISPSIAGIGGPTSVYTGTDLDVPIEMLGHGAAIGTGGTPRAGLLSMYPKDEPYGVGMLLPVIAGDSGSPVRTVEGAAVGNITDDGINRILRYGDVEPATVYGTSVQIVNAETGLNVVTCKSAIPWPLIGCPETSVPFAP